MIGCQLIVKKMKIKLFIILSIFLYSCTEDIYIADPNINYAPVIESITMDSPHILSEQDTTFLRINVWINDENGIGDIQEVVYFINREEFYLGTLNGNLGCEYEEINDNGFITSSEFMLSNTSCYGGYDLALGKVCEELTQEECENSDECLNVDSDQMLYYTFQSFKPSGYPDCGGFGTVKFQFQVTDSSGFQDLSEEIITEIQLP